MLFALSFIAGAIVNFIYGLENVSLMGDVCSGDNDYDSDPEVTDDTCQHLEVVIGTEFALAVSWSSGVVELWCFVIKFLSFSVAS